MLMKEDIQRNIFDEAMLEPRFSTISSRNRQMKLKKAMTTSTSKIIRSQKSHLNLGASKTVLEGDNRYLNMPTLSGDRLCL